MDSYPKSNEAYQAEYTTGILFEGLNAVSKNSKDLDQAVHHYSNVSTNYSFVNLTDDALFRVAEIYLARRNLVLASEKYKEVSKKYPEGDQVKKAQKKYKSIKATAKKRYVNPTSVTRPKIPTSKSPKPNYSVFNFSFSLSPFQISSTSLVLIFFLNIIE